VFPPIGVTRRASGAASASPGPDSYLLELDGVILRGDALVAGADRFLGRLRDTGRRFVIFTADSARSPSDIAARLARAGLDVPVELIWTSALTAARFLAEQHAGGSAFVIGTVALSDAVREAGYRLSDSAPDYVVLGDSPSDSFEAIDHAITLVTGGARFIATTSAPAPPSAHGTVPAAGAIAAMIGQATGVEPYVVGAPNPLMVRGALRAIGANADTAVLVGTRMDIDIVAGIEAGLDAVLVHPGGWDNGAGNRFPLLPSRVVGSVAELVEEIEAAPSVQQPNGRSGRR